MFRDHERSTPRPHAFPPALPRVVPLLSVTLLACALGGCAPDDEATPGEAPATEMPATLAEAVTAPPVVTGALVQIHPTDAYSARGEIRFTALDEGLRMEGELAGFGPERGHGTHVHVHGDCTAPDATSAGRHFNFEEPGVPDPDATRIVGNLGEFLAGPDGTSSRVDTVFGPTLNGPTSIVGRAVVVHETGNEPGPPAGSQSGARVGCGVVGITDTEPTLGPEMSDVEPEMDGS